MAVLLKPVNQTNAKVSENCQHGGVVVVVVAAFLMVVGRWRWVGNHCPRPAANKVV